MEGRSDMLLQFLERIKIATNKSGGLDAKEVASILNDIDDVSVRRAILAQFMLSACSKGDVSEVVAWAVVMSHMEGRRPARDVQHEALYLITEH